MSRPSGRLVGEIVPRAALGAGQRDAMWSLFAGTYEGTPRELFERDLDGKQRVIVMRDGGDGALQGFSTIAEDHGPGRVIVVFSGDTVIAKPYWGQKVLQRLFARAVVETKLRHPLRPVHWLLVTKGYRTYLLLTRNFPCHWPRHDRPTPPEVQKLIGAVARRRFGERFDAARGVLRACAGGGHVRSGVAPIEPRVEADPDVRYFLERNPGHAEGEELCCLGRVDAAFFARFVVKRLGRGALLGLRGGLGGRLAEVEPGDRADERAGHRAEDGEQGADADDAEGHPEDDQGAGDQAGGPGADDPAGEEVAGVAAVGHRRQQADDEEGGIVGAGSAGLVARALVVFGMALGVVGVGSLFAVLGAMTGALVGAVTRLDLRKPAAWTAPQAE